MTKQFWVNNYFIDVNRNQIQHQQQATPIPPKALKVLEVLASRAGDVVSHDELMDIVWENSIVAPNTLQRAVAQLRKAFGDDSKKQAFIKTHAKKGYSLEANVRWEDNVIEKAPNKKKTPSQKSKILFALAIISAVLIIIIASPSKLSIYEKTTPLTASDEQEYNASYSPDGRYLAFNRMVGQCESHLWAKDLNNNQEERLSSEPGHYSQLSWSSDGSQLAFVLQSDCSSEPAQVQQCWQLQTLDFAQAWNGDANNMLRYNCADVETSHPTWLNDGRIALLQHPAVEDNQPKLVIYNAVSDTLTEVPHDHPGQIYSLDYSTKSGLLATVAIASNNVSMLRILNLAGEVKIESEIQRSADHSVYTRFEIQFSPDGEHFITDIEGKIYRLSFDGELQLMHSANHSGLWAPSYHPSQTRFAVTLGSKDFDIGYLNTKQVEADIEVMSRSTSVDANAKFQPNNDLISYISYRSGTRQLWLNDEGKTFQLTKFEKGLSSTRYYWSPDGQTLAVNVNNQVNIVNMDGTYIALKSPIAINTILSWTEPDKLLVTGIKNNIPQLFSIDISTGEANDLTIKNVLWAAYFENNQLVYVDRNKNFWFKDGENILELSAINQKLFGTYVLLKNNALYGIDANDQLWKFDLTTNEINTRYTLNKDISYVSDIKGDKMLATKFIGGRRELVEFNQR
ncbi:winged helix-turn-helix domain-containing protein [Thalassotalea crassostreae]|uniref:winged helix-turn-helix domain-containing protein n=1 Tax=Thalassotalea crassostreae TaxID=1763536 RepID=UPI000837BBBF|nr:winged helix-turn-helix domain-containing protein [Thalassotalea crassostreae]